MKPVIILLSCLMMAVVTPASAQIRGVPDAVAAAERLLARAGGRGAWAEARRFYVEERVFLASGGVAQVRIWRDLETGSRRLERDEEGGRFVEWLSAEGGWDARNGVVRQMDAVELATERQGLRQEPYAIYRRLARNDPALRVELRGDNGLYVFDGDERLLCWFLLDGAGAVTSWANVYDGRINQHFYGPVADMGDANLPRWGVSATGSFRFEYVRAVLDGAPVEPPPRPAA